MATRRSSFRFRLPWSQDDEPASQPSTRPNTITAPLPATPSAAGSKPAAPTTNMTNLSTGETPTSNQLPDPTRNTTPGIQTSPTQAGTKKNYQQPGTSTSSPRPIEPSATSTSATTATGETQSPLQPSNMNPTSTKSPAWSTSQTTTSNPTTPKIAQRPPFRPAGAAPSPKNRASRNETQSSSPLQATNKSRISSPPASPSDTATKSRLPQSPSSSRSTPQSPVATPTSSPPRKLSPVLSTKASQESSDSPSVGKTKMHETNQATILPPSPPKSLQEISRPSSKSTQARSPILDKKEPPEEMGLQTQKVTMSDVSEAKVNFTDKAMQPSEVSVLKSSTMTGTTERPSEKSHSSSIPGESKMLKESTSNIQETKEVVHETRGKNYGAGEKNRQVQSTQVDTVKQEEATKDPRLVNPVSNGRQTTATASQMRNKTIFTGSSQKTAVSSEPHIPLHKEIKDNISNVINRVAVGDGKQETGKTPVNLITLAGDNRGASMQLGPDSSTKGERVHIHRGYKSNPDESADVTTDGEEKRSKDAKATEDQTIAAYVNCNVQGSNNSISCNSSITERNPGVHMSIPRLPSESIHSGVKTGPFEAHKAEFSVTPARTIRRRCLRGLFLESSDSDPEKPRRHGCRVGCNDKKKLTR
ncbi:mucin-5AC [Capsicum galapagoense]